MKNLLLITVLLALSLHVHGKKIPGTIIANGKANEVTFDIKVPFLSGEPNFERIQYRVRYYDHFGKKQTLRPEEADEIRFEYLGMEVRMISCANIFDEAGFYRSPKVFLKLEIDGPLRLYRFYYTASSPATLNAGGGFSPGMSYTADNLVFQKGNGPLKRPRSFGWKKDMLQYFSDCPALRDRIESKDLRKKEIEAIVMYYNQNCAQQ